MHKKHQLFLVLLLVGVTSCQPRMLKVLCLGDSITQGKVVKDSIKELSYRFYLWEKLDSAGYRVDMLGSNSIWFQEKRKKLVKTPVSRYTAHLFDRDHESYYGLRTGQMVNGGFTHDSVKYAPLKERLQKMAAPDCAFIHIGTNDAKNDSLKTINSLKQIIEELYARNPRMTVFLAKLNTPWVRFVNHSVEPVTAEFNVKYPKMQLVPVDIASGWVNCPEAPGSMTFDWAHPNPLGQKVMADKWFKAFQSTRDHRNPKFNANIKLTNFTDSTATISWTPAKDNKYVAGYQVYLNQQPVNWRTSECGSKDKQCIALVDGNSFQLTGLKKRVEYQLSVTAVDYANNASSSKETNFVIP